MPKRKVIQLAPLDDSEAKYATLYALCNDGTMWALHRHAKEWMPVQPIPQTTEAPDAAE